MIATDADLRAILSRTRTIAAVGLSANPVRPSYFVARYLTLKGFRVIPVNPRLAGTELLGEVAFASLSDIPDTLKIDMVDIFRRSDEAGAVVDEAIKALAPRSLATIWMQIGVVDAAAAARARAAGLNVVMDRCPKIEYQRLWGELRWGGFNTGLISSRRD